MHSLMLVAANSLTSQRGRVRAVSLRGSWAIHWHSRTITSVRKVCRYLRAVSGGRSGEVVFVRSIFNGPTANLCGAASSGGVSRFFL